MKRMLCIIAETVQQRHVGFVDRKLVLLNVKLRLRVLLVCETSHLFVRELSSNKVTVGQRRVLDEVEDLKALDQFHPPEEKYGAKNNNKD